MATRHSLGSTAPSSSVGGRPPALKPEHIAVLHEIVQERAKPACRKLPTNCITAALCACAQQRFAVPYAR